MSEREKKEKEEEDLRKWWANLSEEKKDEIRRRQFISPKKCRCPKKIIITCACCEPKKPEPPKP